LIQSFFGQSIKSRVTLFKMTSFSVSLWTSSFFARRTRQSDIEKLAGEQQFTNVRIVAGKANLS
jgi:hypothetical protein